MTNLVQSERADDHTNDRLAVARQIVEIFKLERYCYLAVTLLTAIVVIVVGVLTIMKTGATLSAWTALFGSGGIVAFNVARLLTMFNTVIEKVFKDEPKRGANHARD